MASDALRRYVTTRGLSTCTPEPQPSRATAPPTTQSTPYTIGTASFAQFKRDGRRIPNIEITAEDLKNTPFVPFPVMLKAWLIRMHELKAYDKFGDEIHPNRVGTNDTENQQKEQAAQWAVSTLSTLADEAVAFCNGNTREARSLKKHIKDILVADSETDRYLPLIRGLNSILSHYHQTEVSGIAHEEGIDNLVYMVQDPLAIVSEPLTPGLEARTDRKPDAVGTSVQHLCDLAKFDANDLRAFGYWADYFSEAKPEEWRVVREGQSTAWHDCWNCVEVKCTRIFEGVVFKKFAREGLLDTEEHSTTYCASIPATLDPIEECPGSPTTSATKRQRTKKRALDGDEEDSRKRQRTTANAGKRKQAASRAEKMPNVRHTVTPDIQAAYYGIEMLRAKWDRIHSIVLLLQDDRLSLNWYDTQGCASTHSINIVEDLPLLVMAMILLQRFDHRMRGNAGIELMASIEGESVPFEIASDSHVPWQLKGRRTVSTESVRKQVPEEEHPVSRPHNGQRLTRAKSKVKGASDAASCRPIRTESWPDIFFKHSWREEERPREAIIIREASKRARAPKDGVDPKWVTDHLPEVIFDHEYDFLSTRHIRNALGVSHKGSRTPTWMLSKKLLPFEEVTATEFGGFIWQLIRCHFLLWKLGIAHGDISFWNIMVVVRDGVRFPVLNDFDLAALMDAGAASPEQRGYQRTGTTAFMPLTLLLKSDGSVSRQYHHDLESILWCMAWYLDPKLNWTNMRFRQVYTDKDEWIRSNAESKPREGIREGAEGYWSQVTMTMATWSSTIMFPSRSPTTARGWVELVHAHFPSPIGIEWSSVELNS
ncbi:hypothetical protein BKA70DRAFT_541793 [Coprinopsis sp. MPI-PUGE-AT-0042]|nr:hypothetical protein BKA70DRAFT_541793 [Coprinopsis sp. MPI-PUGE-AT-0042]